MASDADAISGEIDRLEITRLCHVTPSRNLVHILAEGKGVLSTAELSNDERMVFTQLDLARRDRHPDHISCSIQYPNAWYLNQKRNSFGEASNFPDWVMLGIKAHHLSRPDTLFSQGNAAAEDGDGLKAGLAAFNSLYEPVVVNHKGRPFPRADTRLRACPTNDQAEAMIHRRIPLEDITTIFVPDSGQAARQHAGLEQIGVDASGLRYVIAPTLFVPWQLSAEIQRGVVPTEIEWNPPS